MTALSLDEKNHHRRIRRMALWEGRLSRARLMEVVDLSAIRVSQLLREVRDQTPDWFEWDSKSKSYVVTSQAYRHTSSEVKRGDSDLNLAAYLADARIHTDPQPGGSPVIVAPWAFDQVNPSNFSRVRLAIEQSQRLQLQYRSMRTPQPHQRNVEPHHLIQAGRRWHMRGYCLETGDFRDFVLGRIANLTVLDQKATSSVTEDRTWNSVVKVRIHAHPHLSLEQQDLVRHEYFGGTSARVHSCRGALLPYLIQELRLALDLVKESPPEYQLAVQNVEEVRRWLFEA